MPGLVSDTPRMRVNPIGCRPLWVGLVVLAGGAALAAPPPREALTPTAVIGQLPSGEVLRLDPQGMRLSRWDGSALQEIATFRSAPCPPHTFAWDEAARRLAVLCPFRQDAVSVRFQELYVFTGGRRVRSLAPPPLSHVWALAWVAGELHAAGMAAPSLRRALWSDSASWKGRHLEAPRPLWWRLGSGRSRWQVVRAMEPPVQWRVRLQRAAAEAGKRSVDPFEIDYVFEAGAAVFSATASGRWWFFTGASDTVQLLSPDLRLSATYPSPLPPPSTRQVPSLHPRRAPLELWERSFAGVLAAGESLFVVVAGEQHRELIRLDPTGEVKRFALPPGECQWLWRFQRLGRPQPCQLAVGEDWVLVGPPWAVYPLSPTGEGGR